MFIAVLCSKYSVFYEVWSSYHAFRGAVVGDDLPGHTVVGCNNVIGHHAVVGIKCQDMKYKVRATTNDMTLMNSLFCPND